MACKYEGDVPPLTSRVVINLNKREIALCTWQKRQAWDYTAFKCLNKPRALMAFYTSIGYTVTVNERKYKVLEKAKS